MAKEKQDIKTFPLKLELPFSKEIDAYVFYTNTDTKHQYIVNAIKEKMERDKLALNMV